jgi:hypothetical protein
VAENRRPWLMLAAGTVLVLTVALVMVLWPSSDGDGTGERQHDAPSPLSLPGRDESTVPETPGPGAEVEPPAPLLSFSVRLMRSTDDAPLAGGLVVVRRGDTLLAESVTGADGWWHGTIRALPGDVMVLGQVRDHHPEQLTTPLHGDGTDSVILSLAPVEGWIGRVVTTLGDPVPGVTVHVRRSWPARPASVWEHSTGVAARPADDVLVTRAISDAGGYFHILPVPQIEAVDLLIAVDAVGLVSETMRIPLPVGYGSLPDLVAGPARWATVHVLDEHGAPVPDAEVVSDRTLGPWRDAPLPSEPMDGGGRVIQLGVGVTHLRVTAPHRYVKSAMAHGEPLPLRLEDRRPWLGSQAEDLEPPLLAGPLPREDLVFPHTWIEVPPDVTTVDVRLEKGASVGGFVRDGTTGRDLGDVRLTVLSERVTLARTTTSRTGHFMTVLPPPWIGQVVTLLAEHPDYEPLRVLAGTAAFPDGDAGVLYLEPRHPAETITIKVDSSAFSARHEGVEVEAHLWDAPSRWLADGEVPTQRDSSWERLTEPFRERNLRLDTFHQVVGPPSTGKLVVVARVFGEKGRVGMATWGPQPLTAAWAEPLTLIPQRPGGLTVSFSGQPEGEVPALHRISWDPWFDETLAVRVGKAYSAVRGMTAHIPAVGLSALELRDERAPVFRWVAGAPRWYSVDDDGMVSPDRRLDLAHPARFLVSGTVVWHGPDGWPDTCVALLGEGAPGWRRNDLGAWDSWARPGPRGRYRFDDIPAGDYNLVLYRPLGSHAVELLAETAVTVQHDVYNLDIWAEPTDGVGHPVAQSPWGVPEGAPVEGLAAR